MEKRGRAEEETIRVIDKTMVKRVCEILGKRYIVQDISQVEDNKQPEGEWYVEENEEEIRERIVCNGNEILPRTLKKTAAKMTPIPYKEIMEYSDAIPKVSEDEVFENKTMSWKTVKGGKKVEF